MMDTRKSKLFDECLSWVFDHCPDVDAYIRALKEIGFTKTETMAELMYLDWNTKKEAQEMVDKVYGRRKRK